MGCYWLEFAAGARAGAAEAVPSLGGEFVDDLESADVGVAASLEEDEPDPESDFESAPLEPASFEPAPSDPDLA